MNAATYDCLIAHLVDLLDGIREPVRVIGSLELLTNCQRDALAGMLQGMHDMAVEDDTIAAIVANYLRGAEGRRVAQELCMSLILEAEEK